VENKISGIMMAKLSDYNSPNNIIIEDVVFTENFRFHWHEHYEIEYIIEGKGVHIVGNREFPMLPGNLHFMVPTDFHELKIEEPLRIIKIMFDENDINAAVFNTLSEAAGTTNLLFEGEDKVRFDTLMKLCREESEIFKSSPHYPRIMKNLVECVLLNIVDFCAKNNLCKDDAVAMDSGMGLVLAYIHRNFRKPITLKSVAEYSHFSPTYFSRVFHKSMGVTFKEYITSLRMKFATKLLVNTDCSITEVCYESGFGSLSNFINEFRKTYAVSPTAYKKKHRVEKNQ